MVMYFPQKQNLQTAVDEWASDSISATETYGDISTWNVSAITDMSWLFGWKQNITSLDLSGWDTSNVTNMRKCSTSTLSLTVNLSSFDTSNVTNMSAMFTGCLTLTSLDVEQF